MEVPFMVDALGPTLVEPIIVTKEGALELALLNMVRNVNVEQAQVQLSVMKAADFFHIGSKLLDGKSISTEEMLKMVQLLRDILRVELIELEQAIDELDNRRRARIAAAA